jgi:hypothetical protein
MELSIVGEILPNFNSETKSVEIGRHEIHDIENQ